VVYIRTDLSGFDSRTEAVRTDGKLEISVVVDGGSLPRAQASRWITRALRVLNHL
jgi:hypothetical protein